MSDKNFEKAMNRLEELSYLISEKEVTLEDALKYYEEGMKHYNECMDILDEAKQKIETFEGGQE